MGLDLVNTKSQSVFCKDCQDSSPCLSCLALYGDRYRFFLSFEYSEV